MLMINTLAGSIRQLTIDGQLSFIYGNNYKVVTTSNNTAVVSGVYLIVDSGEQIKVSLDFDIIEFRTHIEV